MVGATFEGMCYMHGMCFDMLTPMLYISLCGRRDGEPHVTRALPMSQLWNSKR